MSKTKGHWPKGKFRNDPGSEWLRVKRRLERILRTPERGRKIQGQARRSRRGLGEYMGVSDRQVRRWISGEDQPSSESVAMINMYCSAIVK